MKEGDIVLTPLPQADGRMKIRPSVVLEERLWNAADEVVANSGLKSQEYSAPVLGLIRKLGLATSLKPDLLQKTAEYFAEGEEV